MSFHQYHISTVVPEADGGGKVGQKRREKIPHLVVLETIEEHAESSISGLIFDDSQGPLDVFLELIKPMEGVCIGCHQQEAPAWSGCHSKEKSDSGRKERRMKRPVSIGTISFAVEIQAQESPHVLLSSIAAAAAAARTSF